MHKEWLIFCTLASTSGIFLRTNITEVLRTNITEVTAQRMARLLYISIHFENLSQANIKEIEIPAQKMACLLYISVHFENVSQNKHHRDNCAKKRMVRLSHVTIIHLDNHFSQGKFRSLPTGSLLKNLLSVQN